jgi:DNA-binding Xre family transcriptional regulator
MVTIQVRQVAEKKGISTAYQLQVAAKLSPTVAASLWKGEASRMSLQTINALCNALNCKPGNLFHYERDSDK